MYERNPFVCMLPLKKYISGNNSPFIYRILSKEIMKRYRLRNTFLKNKSETDRKNYVKQRNYCVSLCSGERIRAWISTTLASSKFFLLLFTWIKQRWKHNLNITVITAFLTKLSEFWRLEVEIFIDVWFSLYGTALMANGNLL